MKQMTQYLVGIFVVSVAFTVLVAPQSRAESFSWLLGDKTVSAGESTPSPYEAFPDCQNQEVFIGTATTTRTSICVYRQDGFRYGIWYDKRVLVVGFPNESRMYVVEGVPLSVIYTPGSKDMIIPLSSYPYGSRDLYIVRDFTSKLVRTLTPDLSVSYRLPFEVYTPMFHEADGGVGKITQVGVSRNGEWLAFETYAGDGFALINIKTLELKWFSHYEPSQIVGVWGKTEFSISDDGRRVATAGRWVDVRVYELSDSCGSPFIDGVQHRDAAECPYVSLWSQVATAINNDMDFPMSPRLDRAGGKLTVYAVPIYRSEKPQDARWVTVTAQGYSPTQLEYLALGDSYSSGEGDTEINPITKTKYYLPGTDVKGDKTTPTEKCHISSRSYPYVLKTSMYLSDMTMKSVTCSGAVTGDMSGIGSYLGQGGRLGEFPTITKSLQDQAINNDIPGRIRQIDFVKKYQPAVITLTAGGNDVHFSDVIKSCVLSPFYTCSYAHSNDGKAIIALEIMGLYEKLVTLYKDIHTASPKTKIYVVGYPQFISNRSSLLCAPNVVLNDAERTMVHESVVYINRVIKAAAHTVGVKYLDIEDSLGGHALCGGQQAYVTGVSARGEFGLLSFGSKSEQQESFHPNAKGNKGDC